MSVFEIIVGRTGDALGVRIGGDGIVGAEDFEIAQSEALDKIFDGLVGRPSLIGLTASGGLAVRGAA